MHRVFEKHREGSKAVIPGERPRGWLCVLRVRLRIRDWGGTLRCVALDFLVFL